MTHCRNSLRSLLVVLACLAVIALITGGFLYWTLFTGGSTEIEPRFQVEGLDPGAITGTLPGAPVRESSPGEGTFAYRIDGAPEFSADGAGYIGLQNPAFNQYLMVLEIADETGQVIYRSGYLAPNQYLEEIQLGTPLAPGRHDCTAYINAVDPQTLHYLDALTCPLAIAVE